MHFLKFFILLNQRIFHDYNFIEEIFILRLSNNVWAFSLPARSTKVSFEQKFSSLFAISRLNCKIA